ncbi:hypothetical protein CVD28_02830 [Bacillus sp. M6-12]|uniref:hypothetical protein n=1 Tax=Bacillus sp. M6-12 TaxID=2054166 RepID=UPI000C76EE7C|nr:hypothetical protein [Bacillus sp. M6-12]PLS19367.1 hypothetical protein CVD28_02830 [Bacillus sp. M6-12]
MILYHGTTFASIGSILEKGKLIGTRKIKKHKHAYVSFTPDISMAHEFGLIILAFKDIDTRLIPVKDYDFDWVCQNKEIYEYCDCMEYEDWLDLKYSNDWELLEKSRNLQIHEYVAMNEMSFQPNEVKVMICGAIEEERKEVFQKVHSLYGKDYEIMKENRMTKNISKMKNQHIYSYKNFIREDLCTQDFYKDLLNG